MVTTIREGVSATSRSPVQFVDATSARRPGGHPASELCEPPLEEAALRLRGRELDCPPIGGARLAGASKAAEELGAGGVQVLVVVEREAVDDPERRLRAVDLGDRDGAVELDDGEPVRRASSP